MALTASPESSSSWRCKILPGRTIALLRAWIVVELMTGTLAANPLARLRKQSREASESATNFLLPLFREDRNNVRPKKPRSFNYAKMAPALNGPRNQFGSAEAPVVTIGDFEEAGLYQQIFSMSPSPLSPTTPATPAPITTDPPVEAPQPSVPTPGPGPEPEREPTGVPTSQPKPTGGTVTTSAPTGGTVATFTPTGGTVTTSAPTGGTVTTGAPTSAPDLTITPEPGFVTTFSPTQFPDRVDTSSPTRGGLDSPTPQPTNLPCGGLTRAEAMQSLLSNATAEELLLDPSTPQGQSFEWILETDTDTDPCTSPFVQQRYSLGVFYYAMGGPGWSTSTAWLSPASECTWAGVDCGTDGRNVEMLLLGANNLVGILPEEIKILTSLQIFNAPDNSIMDQFPTGLAGLRSLTEIDIEDNSMNGNPFDVLSSLTNLRRIRLSFNFFSGSLPTDELAGYEKLRELWIARNRMTGPIPTQIGFMGALEELNIYGNQFTGSIPSEIGRLQLKELLAEENILTGDLPLELWKNTNLTVLRLNNNMLQGSLTGGIGQVEELIDLRLSNNTFTGTLPFFLFSLTNLQFMLLGNNSFTGNIRNSFSNFVDLDFAEFRFNSFTGAIPDSIFELDSLRLAYFNDNELEGKIPANIGNPPLLRDLYLDGNNLTGEIPSIVDGQWTNMTELLFHGNNLVGTMPASICALVEPMGTLEDLWTDCEPDTNDQIEVQCDCCTRCFPSEFTR